MVRASDLVGVGSTLDRGASLFDARIFSYFWTTVNTYSRIFSRQSYGLGGEMVSLKELEKWMTTGQVSKRLGRSRQGVIDLAEDKRLRAVKVGGKVWIYDPKRVEAFEKEG